MRVVWLYNRYPKVDNPERVKNKKSQNRKCFISEWSDSVHSLESPAWACELRKSPRQRREGKHTEGQGHWGVQANIELRLRKPLSDTTVLSETPAVINWGDSV